MKIKRIISQVVIFLAVLSMLSGCYSYRDMNELMFYTMGVGDIKDDVFYFYGEAFKAYRGEGDKAGEEKRIVLFGKGGSLTSAVEQMRNSVNNPIEYAGNKIFVYTEDIAKYGLKDTLDIVNRDQKPSLRTYFLIFEGKVEELMNISMEEERFTGLYLYSLMNAQKGSLGVMYNQYFQFIDNMNTGSGINVVPIIRATTVEKEARGDKKGEEGQEEGGGKSTDKSSSDTKNEADQPEKEKEPLAQKYVVIDGGAVFVGDTMKAKLDSRELEMYNLMKGKVVSGLVNTQNPNAAGKTVGFTVLGNKHKYKTAVKDGRIRVDCTVDVRVVLLEVEDRFNSGKDTLEQLKLNLANTLQGRMVQLVDLMKQKKIDILDVKRDLELSGINPEENFLDITDFYIKVNIVLDGTGKLKEVYY